MYPRLSLTAEGRGPQEVTQFSPTLGSHTFQAPGVAIPWGMVDTAWSTGPPALTLRAMAAVGVVGQELLRLIELVGPGQQGAYLLNMFFDIVLPRVSGPLSEEI